MDTVKLEKQIRIIPLLAFIAILVIHQLVEDPKSMAIMWVTLGLSFVASLALGFRIHLEKKNGTYVARRYYMLWFFLTVGAGMFLYNLLGQQA